jgi:integrase
MAIDKGLNLDSVSVLMGHSNTKTTEAYYCRKRQDIAIREAKEVFNAKISYPDAKNPKIESRFDMTGYG